MDIEHKVNSDYFPTTIIECCKFKDGSYVLYYGYQYPFDGKYPDYTFGVWHVKHKILDPNYYCEGQKHLISKI